MVSNTIYSRVENKGKMKKINFLTKDDYLILTKKFEGAHWTPETIDQRWEYHSRVIELIKMLGIDSPGTVLEMGTMGISCVKDSDTLDYVERWNFPGKKPTYVHDARNIPWPINSKQYELFIALRVFQHLTPYQKECTKEAMRIAKKIIIVVPEKYSNKELPHSKGITYSDFRDFTDGVHPNLYVHTQKEYLYYWDTENPSEIDIENVPQQLTLTKHQTVKSGVLRNKFVSLLLGKLKNIKIWS